MSVPRISGGADVLTLTSALAKAGWGDDLATPVFRAARVMLREIATVMYEARKGRTGTIDITAPQLHDRTGYSERWVREALATLEALGLIEWYRGGIVEGAPKPSLIKIVKKTLADFVYTARVWHEDVIERRVIETKARIKATLRWRLCRGRKKIKNPHAEVTAILSLYEGRKGGASRPAPSYPRPSGRGKGASRGNTPSSKGKKTMTPSMPPTEFMPLACAHGADAPRFCNACRSEGWQRAQAADQYSKRVARERAADAARKENEKRKQEEQARTSEWMTYMRSKFPDAQVYQYAKLALQDEEARQWLREHQHA